jgi:hypothetical protein
MMRVHIESFIGFTVHYRSSVCDIFPLALAFFYSAVIKSSPLADLLFQWFYVLKAF